MYYANDEKGIRIDVESAAVGNSYFCPACKSQMIIKRGKIVAPHFAHKSNVHCDPWYTGKMSPWHRRMQDKFPSNMREVALWNDEKTEFHIADALVGNKGNGTVFEFQHSDISVKEFIDRTKFYMSIGCSVVWFFDYQDRGRPKCMYYKDTEYSEQIKRVTWPGRDRVKLMHHYNTEKKQTERFDERMRNYGEYAVRIIDVEEFQNRVFDKAKAQGDYCLAGPMNYLPFDTVRNGTDCFDKLLPFAWQKEWRIAYIHDQEYLKQLAAEDPVRAYEEPYILKIGDISDIAEIVSAKDIFDTPQNIYKGYKVVERIDPMIWPDELKRMGMPEPYQWSAASYRGWGDRASFQNKVIEIDGGRLRLGFDI